jgi:dihydrofolate synthase/folylpolyglutamate synthase
MNYSETLDYLFHSLPMFHRVGAAAYKANLDNTYQLMKLTNHPYQKFKSIHIAGTNGKGSVSHFLASVFQEMGLKTGLYTSPHLKDFRERIRINGEMIPETVVVDFVSKFKSDFDLIQPSFFEMTVAMAYEYFANEKVDVAIIETGLGGRLDSTNVITPLLSIITNIGLDHTQLLGDTLDKIAFEKAGIIKNRVPVVIGESNPITDIVFKQKALLENAPISFADYDYVPQILPQDDPFQLSVSIDNVVLNSPLAGSYQAKNLATLYAAIAMINRYYRYSIPSQIIQKGVANVIANTHFFGRWQKLNDKPLAIADTGHNPHGLKYVLEQLSKLSFRNLHFVLGMVNDKDIHTVLTMLPKNATYYFCKANIPRGMDAELLRTEALEFGLCGATYPSVSEAYASALKQASDEDVVFVGGSTFTVAEVV